jgi:hypothetical protein
MRVKVIWRIDNQVMQRCVMSLMRRRRLKDGIKRPPYAPFLSGPGAGFPFRDSARTVDPIVYQIIQKVVIVMSPSTGYVNKAKGLHHEPARGTSRKTMNPKGLLHEVPGWTYDLGDQSINQKIAGDHVSSQNWCCKRSSIRPLILRLTQFNVHSTICQ